MGKIIWNCHELPSYLINSYHLSTPPQPPGTHRQARPRNRTSERPKGRRGRREAAEVADRLVKKRSTTRVVRGPVQRTPIGMDTIDSDNSQWITKALRRFGG